MKSEHSIQGVAQRTRNGKNTPYAHIRIPLTALPGPSLRKPSPLRSTPHARPSGTGLYALRAPNPLCGFGLAVTIPRATDVLRASGGRTRSRG